MISAFIIAFSMYSKMPMPKIMWTEKNMRYAFCFFPCIGIMIGLFILVVGNVLDIFGFSRIFFACCMTLIPILVTGGIHMDGLLDTIDALSSYADKERKLEILKDPHAGAFAIIGCATYLIWNIGIWSEATKEVLPLIACVYVYSRALSGLSVVSFPLAKNTGLAATFQDRAQRTHVKVTMVCYLIVTSIVLLYLQPILGIIAVMGAVGSFIYHRYICIQKFGGITGDLAGYFLQICELVMITGIIIGAKLI